MRKSRSGQNEILSWMRGKNRAGELQSELLSGWNELRLSGKHELWLSGAGFRRSSGYTEEQGPGGVFLFWGAGASAAVSQKGVPFCKISCQSGPGAISMRDYLPGCQQGRAYGAGMGLAILGIWPDGRSAGDSGSGVSGICYLGSY